MYFQTEWDAFKNTKNVRRLINISGPILKGMQWGGPIGAALNGWGLLFEVKPVYDVFAQNSILMKAVAEYRNLWFPVVEFFEKRIINLEISQFGADLLTLSFVMTLSYIFQGNKLTRHTGYLMLLSVFGFSFFGYVAKTYFGEQIYSDITPEILNNIFIYYLCSFVFISFVHPMLAVKMKFLRELKIIKRFENLEETLTGKPKMKDPIDDWIESISDRELISSSLNVYLKIIGVMVVLTGLTFGIEQLGR